MAVHKSENQETNLIKYDPEAWMMEQNMNKIFSDRE